MKSMTIDAYIAAAPVHARPLLQEIREAIHTAVPGAEECISYGMPAFRQGRVLLYFAACKGHIGIYPTAEGMAEFAPRLTEYKTSKGAVQVPYGAPVPLELIAEMARWRAERTR